MSDVYTVVCQIIVPLWSAGKDHVCHFVGCGQNERFTYVVMELQVEFSRSPLVKCFVCCWDKITVLHNKSHTSFVSQGEKSGRFTQNHEWRYLLCLNHFTPWKADFRGHWKHSFCWFPAPRYQTCELSSHPTTLLRCSTHSPCNCSWICFCLSVFLKL